jgi:voltage-gated potassium channel
VSEARVDRWELRSEWPLAAVAALFLGAYAWPILDEHLSSGWKHSCEAVDYAAWAVFAIDYCIRLYLAEHRGHYWSHHLPDLAVIVLPILRPLRLLRLVMLLKVLNRTAADSLRGRIVVYVVGATGLLVLCAALAVLDAERHHAGANITTFPDALWWAIVTITTVGYGDRFPVTGDGRLVATGLMIGGIALLGIVTATLASWLIDAVRQSEATEQAATREDIHRIDAKLEELRTMMLNLDQNAGARLKGD